MSILKNIVTAGIGVILVTIIMVSCSNPQYTILYDYFNSYKQFEHKKDTILGRVELPVLQFRSDKVAREFGKIFDELAKDSLSTEYKLIFRVDNDTVKFLIQSWGNDISIKEEIDFPKLNRGIIRHKKDTGIKDIFVIYALNSDNPERCSEIFTSTGGVNRYELRGHYVPYKVTMSYPDDMQYYLGFYANDSIVLIKKQERRAHQVKVIE